MRLCFMNTLWFCDVILDNNVNYRQNLMWESILQGIASLLHLSIASDICMYSYVHLYILYSDRYVSLCLFLYKLCIYTWFDWYTYPDKILFTCSSRQPDTDSLRDCSELLIIKALFWQHRLGWGRSDCLQVPCSLPVLPFYLVFFSPSFYR